MSVNGTGYIMACDVETGRRRIHNNGELALRMGGIGVSHYEYLYIHDPTLNDGDDSAGLSTRYELRS